MRHVEPGNGCAQHMGWGHDEHGTFEILCGKITDPDKALCPHHELLLTEAEMDRQGKAKRRADTETCKAALREALEHSPLRAENPKFAQDSNTGYES